MHHQNPLARGFWWCTRFCPQLGRSYQQCSLSQHSDSFSPSSRYAESSALCFRWKYNSLQFSGKRSRISVPCSLGIRAPLFNFESITRSRPDPLISDNLELDLFFSRRSSWPVVVHVDRCRERAWWSSIKNE